MTDSGGRLKRHATDIKNHLTLRFKKKKMVLPCFIKTFLLIQNTTFKTGRMHLSLVRLHLLCVCVCALMLLAALFSVCVYTCVGSVFMCV